MREGRLLTPRNQEAEGGRGRIRKGDKSLQVIPL